MAKTLWDAKEFREEASLKEALKNVCPLAEKLAAIKDSPIRADALEVKVGCAPGYYTGVFAGADQPTSEPIKPDPRLVHVDSAIKMLWAHASEKLEAFGNLNKPE